MGNLSKTDAGGLDFDTQHPSAGIFIDAAIQKSLKFLTSIRCNFYQIFRAVEMSLGIEPLGRVGTERTILLDEVDMQLGMN